VLTGLLYANPRAPSFLDLLGLAGEPLATLPEERTRPPREVLDEVIASLR
jgi:2-oxoglutarate ferredoxin oxidoreductase subunit beta